MAKEAIDGAVQRLVEAAQPTRVILFGSYARGDATEDSDVDFLVVERAVDDKVAEMVRLRRAVGSLGTGVDLFVVSEDEVAQWSAVPGTTLHQALQEGRVLHDAAR